MKALKAYNTEAISRFHQRKVHNTEIVESTQNDAPGPPVPENDLPDLPESDLDIPGDPIFEFVNSQCQSSEDFDQALQAYQAYQVPCPQDSTMIPERSINCHFTKHVAQASQAKHGSLVDRGANGGLIGSDVRILSRSSRKCTVTAIDSHELQVVQCAALVETNHGIVNLIMNEYAYYGKGHTIHSSGQIECDRIPSTTPGAEPPRDARDSGSARSHSTQIETSSSDRPKMATYTEPQTVSSYMSVKCTRRTLRMPNFTRATHAQPSLSDFPWRDSDFGERARSRGTTRLERNFPTSPQNKKTKLTHCLIYVPMRTISTPHTK